MEPVSARDVFIFATGLQDRGKYELGKYSGIYINRSNTVDTNGISTKEWNQTNSSMGARNYLGLLTIL